MSAVAPVASSCILAGYGTVSPDAASVCENGNRRTAEGRLPGGGCVVGHAGVARQGAKPCFGGTDRHAGGTSVADARGAAADPVSAT